MASSGAAQAATRSGTGRRRQGPASGPAAGAKAQAGAAMSAPALRPLDELRAEWMRRRERAGGETVKAESVKQNGGGAAAAGGANSGGGGGGGQRRKAQGGNSRSGSNGANGADAGAALLRMLKSNPDSRGNAPSSVRSPEKKHKRAEDNMGGAVGQSPTACSLPDSEQAATYDEYDYWESDENSRDMFATDTLYDGGTEAVDSEETRYARDVMLRMRPRPAPLPEAPQLPTILNLQHEASQQCAQTSADAAVTTGTTDGAAADETPEANAEASPDSLFDAAAADALDWGLDEDEEQPAGLDASRGFSKWFARRKGSSGNGLGEAGVSTDAGSGADESSDEEAELQLTSCDGLPAGDYDVDLAYPAFTEALLDAPSTGGAASAGDSSQPEETPADGPAADTDTSAEAAEAALVAEASDNVETANVDLVKADQVEDSDVVHPECVANAT